MKKKILVFLVGYNFLNELKGFKNKNYHFIVPSKEEAFSYHLRRKFKKVFGSHLHTSDYSRENLKKILLKINADYLISLGWRRIIPNEFINLHVKCVNIHPAILPEYKGYHPIPYVLMNNEKKHGITAHLMTENVDAGGIIFCKKFNIDQLSTIVSIQNKIKKMIPSFLRKLINILNSKKIKIKLNKCKRTKIIAPKRSPKDSEIDANMKFKDAFNLIRSCDPKRFPAYYLVNRKKIYVSLFSNIANKDKKYQGDI